jgi:hypothetical protein
MARLFVFAIGGTGSRVLKSLTMLLASGVKPNSEKEFEIVPIIIDPHKSNEDLKRTERLLGNYQTISNEAGLTNGFFNTKITTRCWCTFRCVCVGVGLRGGEFYEFRVSRKFI